MPNDHISYLDRSIPQTFSTFQAGCNLKPSLNNKVFNEHIAYTTHTCWSLYTLARRSKLWLDIRGKLCSLKHHYLLELVHPGKEMQDMVGHQEKLVFPEAVLCDFFSFANTEHFFIDSFTRIRSSGERESI